MYAADNLTLIDLPELTKVAVSKSHLLEQQRMEFILSSDAA